MPEQKTYLQKVADFSQAVHAQNAYEKLHFDGAKDFCDFMLPALDSLPRFVTSYAELGNAYATCAEEHLTGEEYRDFMEPRHRGCELSRDSARSGIKTLNRMFTAMGMEPFADIDLEDNTQVAMVCGQVMLEHVGKLDEYEAQLQAGNKSIDRTAYLAKAADETKANPGSAYASMRRYLDTVDGTDGGPAHDGPSEPGVK